MKEVITVLSFLVGIPLSYVVYGLIEKKLAYTPILKSLLDLDWEVESNVPYEATYIIGREVYNTTTRGSLLSTTYNGEEIKIGRTRESDEVQYHNYSSLELSDVQMEEIFKHAKRK